MRLPAVLGLLRRAEHDLGGGFRAVAEGHGDEPDVRLLCRSFATQCEAHAARLDPVVERYGEQAVQPSLARFGGTRPGGLGLVRDLHDLFVMASEVDIAWTLVGQAALALRGLELLDAVRGSERETGAQLKWLRTRMKEAAPQALVTAP
jgi:hypothetical protein